MFREERDEPKFTWTMLGDVDLGRPHLGQSTSVSVYRLMQFTLRDILIKQYGVNAADHVFLEAGKLAGMHLYENLVPKGLGFPEYVRELQQILKDLKVGILRVERADLVRLTFQLTLAEDLDCSGLPVCDEQVCTYDEGFIAGLLQAYTNREFIVKEIDCWCSGDRVCRFDAKAVQL